jgi:hypothetical protein
MNIKEFRQTYPQYNDVSDTDLSTQLHQKFYSDMPYEKFAKDFGVVVPPPPKTTITEDIKAGVSSFAGGLTGLGDLVDKFGRNTPRSRYNPNTKPYDPNNAVFKNIQEGIDKGIGFNHEEDAKKNPGISGHVIRGGTQLAGTIVTGGLPIAVGQGVGAGNNLYDFLVKNGVDKKTALQAAGWQGASTTASLAIPGVGKWVSHWGAKALLGGGINAAQDVGTDAITYAILKNAGYDDAAKMFEFNPDKTAAAGILGTSAVLAPSEKRGKESNRVADLTSKKEPTVPMAVPPQEPTTPAQRELPFGQMHLPFPPVEPKTQTNQFMTSDPSVPALLGGKKLSQPEPNQQQPALFGPKPMEQTSLFGEPPAPAPQPQRDPTFPALLGRRTVEEPPQAALFREPVPQEPPNRMQPEPYQASLFSDEEAPRTLPEPGTTEPFHNGTVNDVKPIASFPIEKPTKRSTMGGVGRKQGGAIDPDMLGLGAIKKWWNYGKNEEPQRERDPNRIVRGVPGLDNYEYLDDPNKALSLAKEAPDISDKLAMTKDIQPGMRGAAVRTNNPVLRFTLAQVNKAENKAREFIRQHVTGEFGSKDNLDGYWKSMTKEEQTEAIQVLFKGDREEHFWTPEELGNFSETQRKFIQKFYEMDDLMYQEINKYREAHGQQPMERRQGHVPGVFDDSFQALIRKRETTSTGKTVWKVDQMVGAENALVLQKRLSQFRNNPDYDVLQLPRRTLGSTASGWGYLEGTRKVLAMLDQNDPELAQRAKDIIMSEKSLVDHGLFGMDVHEKEKKGIPGSAGNKAWRSEHQNAKDAYKAFLDYFEEGMRAHIYKNEVLPEWRKVIDDPGVREQQRNAISWAEDYMDLQLGEIGKIGTALNTILDGVSYVASGGMGAKSRFEVTSTIKNEMSHLMMGWGNIMFTLTQLGQLGQTGLPQMMKAANALELSPLEMSEAGLKGGYNFLAGMAEALGAKPGKFDAFDRQAYQEMVKRGITSFSELEKMKQSSKNKVLRAKDRVAELNMQLGEQATRPLVYMAMVDMLKRSRERTRYSDKQIFDIAENLTQEAMIDYNKEERPMMYRKMGVLGNFAGGLTTFKHGYLGFMYNLSKDKNKAPIAAAVAGMLAMGGLMGLPFMDEIEDIVLSISKHFSDEPVSVKEIMMHTLPDWATFGVLSDKLGFNVSSRFSSANMIPDYGNYEFLSPQLSMFGRNLKKTGEAIKGGMQTSDLQNMTQTWLPNSMKGYAQVEGMGPSIPPMYEQNMLTKDGKIQRERTDQEKSAMKWLGASSMDEAKGRHTEFMGQMRTASRNEHIAEATKQAVHLLLNDNLGDKELQDIVDTYAKYGGDVKSLVSQLSTQAMEAKKTEKERREGLPKRSMSSIQRWLNYNR